MSDLRDQLLACLSVQRMSPTTFGGVRCNIKHLTEREKIEAYLLEIADKKDEGSVDKYIRCRTIALALCDDSRQLIFNREDIDRIADFPATDVERVFDEIMKVNNAVSIDDASSVDEAKKN